jgi:hypothetical protein
MSSINWGRVILGGLLAGVLINVFEFLLNGVVLANDWRAAMLADLKIELKTCDLVVEDRIHGWW